MNKEKNFQHYRPFLEWLLGAMKVEDYGMLFWPGSTNAKKNFSRFITHGEKSAEVKRRIAELLALEPGLLARIGCDVNSDDHQIDVDVVVARLTTDRVCEYFEPAWQMMKVIEALKNSLELISRLSASQDPKTAVLWLGISVLLQRANEIPVESLRDLEGILNKAICACSYLTDKTHMVEAEIMFRNRVLTPNPNLKQRISHTRCMANSR